MLFRNLLILFIAVPLIELAVLVKLGEVWGFMPTIMLVLLTGISGAYLTRREGLSVWLRIQNDMAEGRMPADKLLDGLLILIGGVLLLTPGLLTDITGFCLVLPPTRRIAKTWISKKFQSKLRNGSSQFYYHDGQN